MSCLIVWKGLLLINSYSDGKVMDVKQTILQYLQIKSSTKPQSLNKELLPDRMSLISSQVI